MIPAQEALERLREGNKRYASDQGGSSLLSGQARRQELLEGQEPFAIILGCSDSRVPSEIVFDQFLGDLFVIRVAGNFAAPSQIASAEFAASVFGTRLILALGHSNCGAVVATLQEMKKPLADRATNLDSIVNSILPAVEPFVDRSDGEVSPELVDQAVRANIRASATRLRMGSAILKDLIENDGLIVVGAEYDLQSGLVDFFDGVP